jgi:hypothetical protein
MPNELKNMDFNDEPISEPNNIEDPTNQIYSPSHNAENKDNDSMAIIGAIILITTIILFFVILFYSILILIF